jgi:hypothetical protein
MRRMTFSIALFAIAGVLFGTTPALAAPGPSNDRIAGATVITALPFSDTVNTTKATTDPEEAAASQPCLDFGAPAVEKGVWYTYTASRDITLLVDTLASDYTTGIAVYSGAPSASTFVTCAPGRLTTSVAAGQTVYLLIFADQPGSPGGTLRISVQEAPPPPVVSLTVDPVGSFDSSGNATISGTIMCTGIADFTSFTCDGTTQTWTATTQQSSGKFAGGQATVQASAVACNVSGCGSDFVTQQVRLRK